MARSLRVEFAGALYHVMARGVARLPTFLDDEDRRDFLAGVGRRVEEGDLLIHAFCLMPNHYHLLVETPRGRLARWMRHVNGDYARRFQVRHRRVGPVWQGRYKAILVEDGPYLLECSRYIHLNRSRSKLARPAQGYWWSSYRNYAGGSCAVDWVTTERVLGEWDGDRASYRRYVEEGEGAKPVSPFDRATARLALGGEAFVARIRKLLDKRPDHPEIPALRALRKTARPAPERVEEAVEEVFGGEPERRRGRLRLYALRKYSALGTSAIARRYGRTPASVPVAVKCIEIRAADSRTLSAKLRQLGERLRRS